jgi:hypothetical protein
MPSISSTSNHHPTFSKPKPRARFLQTKAEYQASGQRELDKISKRLDALAIDESLVPRNELPLKKMVKNHSKSSTLAMWGLTFLPSCGLTSFGAIYELIKYCIKSDADIKVIKYPKKKHAIQSVRYDLKNALTPNDKGEYHIPFYQPGKEWFGHGVKVTIKETDPEKAGKLYELAKKTVKEDTEPLLGDGKDSGKKHTVKYSPLSRPINWMNKL